MALKRAGPDPGQLKEERLPWRWRAKPTWNSNKGSKAEGTSLREAAREGGKARATQTLRASAQIMFERPEALVLNILLYCVTAVQENSSQIKTPKMLCSLT